MSSQNVGMDSATKMVLPVGQRPGRENQSNSSESQVYNRENLLRQGDRVGIQDEAVQGGQLTANEEGNTNLFQQPFPRKLWTIVQNETFQCLNWSEDRDSITIKVDMFQREVLHRRATGKIFETKILQSFIRQLYRYGFRKIRPKDSSLLSRVSRKMMVYRTFNFQRDKPELLKIIRRKKWVSKATSPVPSAVEQGQDPKKVKLLPPGLYQWFQKREHDGMKSQQRGPNNQTPAGNLSTRLSSTYNQSNIPESVPDNCPPQQTSVPCGEGTSDNATVPPLATGHVPSSSSRYLRYGYMMSMYDTCYSILKAALSAISLSQSTAEEGEEEEEEGEDDEWEDQEEEEEEEEEEEQEGENSCMFCGLFKSQTTS
ncbi:heat shock transcription factor, X-linked member 3-like [Cricetulus griseus]|uniref:Heat shock transcription factor, X-linked member 3-like n=2 Tax=Cricetulus griseus TaxID=10029 RepID=A0A9J7GNE7_CRIGR|nr:heat shock transcription factor, X-linked member 3-like [Cricetulus griseus]